MSHGKFPFFISSKPYRWTVADIVVILAVIVFGLFCLRLNPFPSSNAEQNALIFRQGARVTVISLDEDKRISLMKFGVNMVLETRNGAIRVLSSDCKRQICVGQGWISRSGEKIFCLPNGITIELVGAKSSYDIISY